ncbi:hypothetical protein Zmor_015064 [Zophobas morio]|uniref:Uncharacterized protein n=1 Tax=Zophobas morio TaxID=2755281 RepID=A0AA38MGT4_9CUCU|nr:hypothetical protein Zmor_015064 [Zophobas morio]
MLGHCKRSCTQQNKTYEIESYVVNDIREPLLGLTTCIRLNLITKNEPSVGHCEPTLVNAIVNSNNAFKNDGVGVLFGDVFTGIGCIQPKYHIQVEENAQPVISPIRKVPFALIDQLKVTLNKL